MSAVFLLGAGASFGSGECYPTPPPLGRDLFPALASRGGIAASINGRLRNQFLENFELGMDSFRRERDIDSTAFLREMAAYFVTFAPGPGNHYHRLVRAIRGSSRRAVIATTNYDVLLEQVISSAGLRIAYATHKIPRDTLSVLKIHGSCHFLPDLGTNMIRGCTFSGNGANVEAPTRIAQSAAEVLRFCSVEDSLAPAIALYAPGKKVLFCPSFVQGQQAAWKTAALEARTIYVIGLRVLPDDDHIWDVLARAEGSIEYVGLEPHEFMGWADSRRRKRVHVLEGTIEQALPFIEMQLRH